MKNITLSIVAVLFALIIALSGCGGGGGGPKLFAYVANSGSNNITAYSINPDTGTLTSMGTIGAGTEPFSVTTDPAGNYLYAVNRTSKNISIYSIDATSGQLAEITGSPVATVYSPGSLAMNPGVFTYAYVANTDASLITPYRTEFYNGTGKLTYINALNPIGCGNYCWSIAADPTGQFVYAAVRDANYIYGYTVNVSTGALEVITGSPFAAGNGPWSIAIEPSGKYLYTANYGSHTVSAYSITASTGALASIGSFPAGTNPRSAAIDPSGKFLYVANQNSNNISAYAINAASGVLSAVSGSPFADGTGNSIPVSVTVDPTGKFVYVVYNNSDNVQAFTINGTNGALTPAGSAVAAGHWPVSIVTVRK